MFDVIIIGGSYAGLSAAMALGRSMRNVLVLDSSKPCNRQTPHSHNFLLHDGDTPAALAQKAKEQVLKYNTLKWLTNEVIAVTKMAAGFEIQIANGEKFQSRKIIFATGVADVMPVIKGFAECWGISVLHCPYCHGYEVKDEPLGVIANGGTAFEMVKMIQHWSKNLVLFCNNTSTLTAKQTQKIQFHHIEIIEKEIAELVHDNGYVKHLLFADGSVRERKAVFARVPCKQPSPLQLQLGCALTENGLIQVDAFQKTTVAGIYAAGDCTSLFRGLSAAVAAGGLAGAMVNRELIEENFE